MINNNMNKIALVTGATSGIGKATARALAIEGYNLIITGRRSKMLFDFALELQSKSKIDKSKSKNYIEVLPLCFDIRSQEDVKNNLCSLPPEWSNISVLVNNAGLALGLNPINEGVVDDWERMIDTNIKGMLYITRIVSNMMIERGGGHIINICSIAGKETYTNGNVYCATKHAVESLTKGMRLDLLQHGIKVSSVAPGAVDTEFSLVRFKGDKKRAEKVYEGFTPLYAKDIAETILFVVTRPAHVNIDDILVMPAAQAFSRDFDRK